MCAITRKGICVTDAYLLFFPLGVTLSNILDQPSLPRGTCVKVIIIYSYLGKRGVHNYFTNQHVDSQSWEVLLHIKQDNKRVHWREFLLFITVTSVLMPQEIIAKIHP